MASSRSYETREQEVQAAIAKTMELRAIHASLLNLRSPARPKFPLSAPPPVPSGSHRSPARDYPVFTPSYADAWASEHHHIQPENRPASENRSRLGLETAKSAHRTELPYSEGLNTVKSCSSIKSAEGEVLNKNLEDVYPSGSSISSRLSSQPRPTNKGKILPWILKRLKKTRAEVPPLKAEPFLKTLGMLSIGSLRGHLIEASGGRDAASVVAPEMKSSLQDLNQRLLDLEAYCNELKKSLQQAVQVRDAEAAEMPGPSPRAGDSLLPVSREIMVEGFLQIVSEARLSVNHFCKTLLTQIEETEHDSTEVLNSIVLHQKLTSSRNSRRVFYHLESLINQFLHQDFENCAFHRNGAQMVLEPLQSRRAKFSEFVELRNLSWDDVLRKGTRHYCEKFSRFCDQKMSGIVAMLKCSQAWPEQLLQSFFVAAKCIWLLHLLAFSFHPPLTILRVGRNIAFDPLYMEDVAAERPKSQAPAQVKIMVMPGFYIEDDHVLKCKVLCRYRSGA